MVYQIFKVLYQARQALGHLWKINIKFLTLDLLNPYLFSSNTVDPDQLVFSTRQSDQDLHCFPHKLKIHANNWNAAGEQINI